MVLGYPTSASFPRVDGWSTNPWVLGRHSLVSELRYTSTLGLRGMGLGQEIYGEFGTNVIAWYPSLGIRTPKAWWAWV